MTCRSFSPPVGPPRSDLPLPDAAWLDLWRAFWLDLPQAWADEIVRSFNRCLPPVGEGP
ncbi:protein of unknown function [Methylorubrum extorquens DM4]|jgi:hypothetical protein|uniref:Uncharacterized protein n=1 Tax=Methylorubrum extorquens (strain DSM 6343 / CIP 106787 / DM4) TaxID=661410 RepID=C7CFN7_METED|nr:hypothetical protein [Methylorubrum extorquens]MCP1587157.1 hypothetical protein [Methylorubrum extorquens]CAX26171.1 protein of unknown function [Methylorubrum extorquens DM4]